MSPRQHSITHLVVHKFIKRPDSPAAVELRSGNCPLDDPAVRLVERLCGHYADRSSKGYGRFEDDEASLPMARLMRDCVLEQSIDFATLAQRMMQHLQTCVDEDEQEVGSFVLIARILEGATDSLWVAVLGEVIGTAINGGLDIVDCAHLDFSSVRAAGRIDLTGWQRGDERYVSFLKGRSDAAWFRHFLGCGDGVIALKETKKLVLALNQFVEAERLEPAARDALFERAHVYLDELCETGEPLALDEVARQVWPDQPERLDAALNTEAVKLASGFVPNRRALRPLVRFSASGEQWKLEFDRSGLRSGAVQYDRASDTLVLSGLPDYLKRMLTEESSEN